MSRRKRGEPVHGVVLLDKPAGLSSNQALQKVRRLFDAQKAGHTGSLDPFATGMLPICLGEASKTAAFMLDADKSYRAVALLGAATATGDPEGEVVETGPVPAMSDTEIKRALNGFSGTIEQVPPMYSALKHQGKPLYEWARQGIEIERKSRSVTIHSIELQAWRPPELEFELVCSKGTYIRTLAEDIARACGTVAHLISLRRLYVQPFESIPMVSLEQVQEAAANGTATSHLLPPDAGLSAWPVARIDADQVQAFGNGNPVEAAGCEAGWVRVYAADGGLLGLAECTAEGLLKPRRVMHLQDAGADPQSAV